jgi:hypothetical protein
MKTIRDSGVYLLQEIRPTKLIGGLNAGIYEDGSGWIKLGVFPGETGVWLGETDDERFIGMARDLVERFIGAIYVLLSANWWMRDAPTASGALTRAEGRFRIEVQIARVGRPGQVRCYWSKNGSEIEIIEAEGQTDVRFPEEFARDLVSGIVRELGRIAAGRNS